MKTLYGLTEAQMREVCDKVLTHDVSTIIATDMANGGWFDYTAEELLKMVNISAVMDLLMEHFYTDAWNQLPNIIEDEIYEYKRINQED